MVDNNFNAPNGPLIFTTLQEAADQADLMPGTQIIQVKPSPNNYGNVTLRTPVILQGIGFDLTKEFPYESIIGDINLSVKGDLSENATGTLITGLRIDEIFLSITTAVNLANVEVFNNVIGRIQLASGRTVDNYLFRYNYIYGVASYSLLLYGFIDNSTFRNNVIVGQWWFDNTNPSSNVVNNNIIYGSIKFNALGTYTLFINNNFIGDNTNSFLTNFRDCTLNNNIFFGRAPRGATSNFHGNSFNNNISWQTSADALPPAEINGPPNIGQDNKPTENPLFVNAPNLTNSWDATYDFNLQVGSPALTAGSDGTDIGITGGPNPWLDGNLILRTTAIPTIESLNTSGVVNPIEAVSYHMVAASPSLAGCLRSEYRSDRIFH
jgi:hypothetical protein